jgi:hypothetical protein
VESARAMRRVVVSFKNTSSILCMLVGDVANTDVESYAADTTTGNACPREGTLVVTAPNDSVAHELPVALPICSATISSVD